MRQRSVIVLGGLLPGAILAVTIFAQPAGLEPRREGADALPTLGFELRSFPQKANPPLPDPDLFPIQLVLDDDQAEGVFGFGGANARQFLWFQRFSSPGPFVLGEVWVLFPSGMDVPPGGPVELAVYLDPDGDPANGATLLAAWDDVVQAADGDTFSVYPLPSELQILEAGDVLIGAVSRFFVTGVDPPPTRPAARDTSAGQGRAWYALWAGDPPDPPELADALAIAVLDGAWMIRGFGTPVPVIEIPALGGAGLALLALLLGAAAMLRLRR